jgi:16S rRNA processing protein RimM
LTSLLMLQALDSAPLPDDAVEVARIVGAWGVKGWLKVMPHSAQPEALFSSKRWYLQPSDRGPQAFTGCLLLRVREAREHGGGVVAQVQDIQDKDAADALKGARVFVARSSFPTAADDEFYWVDLIGLAVVNREGVELGTVRELMSTGPQTVLVIEQPGVAGDKPVERMVPFVSAFVDAVDLPGRRITVDWQPDY